MTDRWRVGANLATLGNGLLGVGAVLYTWAGNRLWAMLLIAMAIGLDGLDGMLSRRSAAAPRAFGRVADTIADATTFGVAPAILLSVHTTNSEVWSPYGSATLLAAAIYLGAALARLTYFTVRGHTLRYFLGVPTPQSALAIVVAVLFLDTPGLVAVSPTALVAAALGVSVLMVAPIPYPKIRRGSPLRGAMTGTAVVAALALVPLQFHPATGSGLLALATIAAWGFLVGVLAYYLAGPFAHGVRGGD